MSSSAGGHADPGLGSTGADIGPLTRAALDGLSEQDQAAVVRSRDEILSGLADEFKRAMRSASQTSRWAGHLVQAAGAGLVAAALAFQIGGERDLVAAEFVVVVIGGIALIVVGPLIGNQAADQLLDEKQLVRNVTERVQRVERLIAAKKKDAGVDAGAPGQ